MTPEERARCSQEMAIRLKKEGFGITPQEDMCLQVTWNNQRLCLAVPAPGGNMRYFPDDIVGPEMETARLRVSGIINETAEYMALMEQAPQIRASGLDGDYRALAEFNGVVLAGHPTKYGVEFVTWEWVQDHTSLWQGHYTGDYTAAKEDFAVRSGMLPKERVFSDQQLTEVYRCVQETLESGSPLTREREKILSSITAQIELSLPNLSDLVQQSNEKELIQGEADDPGMTQQF